MTTQPTPAERLSAGAISLVSWTGLGLQLTAALDYDRSVLHAVWNMLRFFTITTNVAVAVLFAGIALGIEPWRGPRKVAGIAMAILLVGIVFQLLLRGLIPHAGLAWAADFLMHSIAPVAVPLYWLAFTLKGRLRWPDPLVWAIYPLVYFGYVLLRVNIGGSRYPYPFLNAPEIGWAQVTINVIAISVGFLAAGYGVVALDTWLRRRRA